MREYEYNGDVVFEEGADPDGHSSTSFPGVAHTLFLARTRVSGARTRDLFVLERRGGGEGWGGEETPTVTLLPLYYSQA